MLAMKAARGGPCPLACVARETDHSPGEASRAGAQAREQGRDGVRHRAGCHPTPALPIKGREWFGWGRPN
ncbi:hypothetical protein GCM10011587_08550 [Pyruvatibacter mobilis]|nr:hypothetical protein GCM10011587_08550 [Pyruvatibacter mobilis]